MMRFMKIYLLVSLLVLFVGSNLAVAAEKTYTIKFAHIMNAKHCYQKGGEKFKELIEKRTNGRIQVKLFPGAQLGNEAAMLEGYQLGTLEMGVNGSGGFANLVPEVAVLDLGYIFKDGKQAMKALNGKVGNYVNEQLLKKQGIRCMGYFDYGFRNVYSKKEIRTPEDLKGLKIRTMTNKAHMALFKAFGANPTPMGWGELYTSLQQGVIDGAENNADVWFDQGHYEVAPIMSQTQHLFLVVGYFMSEKFYQSLPSDLQKAVTKAAKEAMQYNSEVGLKGIVDARPVLEKKGARFVDIKDLTPFAKIARSTWMPIAQGVPNGEKLLKIVMDETGVKLE